MHMFYSNYSRMIWVKLWLGLGNLICQKVETWSGVTSARFETLVRWNTETLTWWFQL